jgi:hypothetical protein
MNRPQSISDPITAAQAETLPHWYWNVRSGDVALTPEQISEARRAARKSEVKARARARARAKNRDAVLLASAA